MAEFKVRRNLKMAGLRKRAFKIVAGTKVSDPTRRHTVCHNEFILHVYIRHLFTHQRLKLGYGCQLILHGAMLLGINRSFSMFVYILRHLFTYQVKIRLGAKLSAEIRSSAIFVDNT